MEGSTMSSWQSVIFYTILSTAALISSIYYMSADIGSIIPSVPDDAFYFLKVAENLGSGYGQTFDRINQTNGLQPLWLYVLSLVYFLHDGTPEAMFRISMLLQVIILTITVIILYRVQTRVYSKDAALICGLLFLILVYQIALNGMESPILVLALSILFAQGWVTSIRRTRTNAFLLGAIMGLCVLARLDMVFLSLASFVLLFSMVKDIRSVCLRDLLLPSWAFLGLALLIGPYLMGNITLFGGIFPINYALKSSFPSISMENGRVDIEPFTAKMGVLSAIIYSLIKVKKYLCRGRIQYPEAFLVALSFTVILDQLHFMLFMRWAVFSWHFIPHIFIIPLIACEPIHRLTSNPKRMLFQAAYWIFVVLLAFKAFETYSIYPLPKQDPNNFEYQSYMAALWARSNTSASDVFAMKDSGVFGYFSMRRVINLDGLVNNMDYQGVLRAGRLSEYLRDNHVGYIAQHAIWDDEDVMEGNYIGYRMYYYSNIYRVGDSIQLRKDCERYRSVAYYDGPYLTPFIVWDFPGCVLSKRS
jgi:hypothetical protein